MKDYIVIAQLAGEQPVSIPVKAHNNIYAIIKAKKKITVSNNATLQLKVERV